MDNNKPKQTNKVPWYAYLALLLTILFLSGIFTNIGDSVSGLKFLEALDFNNIVGEFGVLGTLTEGSGKLASNFKGIGGSGAKEAFLLVFTVAPSIIVAFGVIELCRDYKGLEAAQKLFSPLLKPMLGLPGATALGIVSSFTSSDATAGITKSLYDDKYIDERQRLILTAFHFSAPAILVNIFAVGAPILPYITHPVSIALLVVVIMKFVGAILCRIYLGFAMKKKGAE